MEQDVFICDCADLEHQFVVSFDPDDPREPVFINVRLNHFLGFFGRLRAAVKYLFKCGEANYDEVIIDKKKTEHLIETLSRKQFNQ